MDNQQINIETTGIRVYSEITDLNDADTGQTGTRVTIFYTFAYNLGLYFAVMYQRDVEVILSTWMNSRESLLVYGDRKAGKTTLAEMFTSFKFFRILYLSKYR